MSEETNGMRESLRRVLDDLAGEAPPAGPPDPGVLRRARRRMAWTGAATSLALVVAIAAGAVAVPRLLDRDGAPGTGPTPSPTGRPDGPPPAEGTHLFINGRTFRFDDQGVMHSVGDIPGDLARYAQPVVTPFGTLVLEFSGDSTFMDLWLVAGRDERVRIAEGVGQGFAVSGDGRLVAYGKPAQDQRSAVLYVSSVETHDVLASSPTLPRNGSASGFVDEQVLATTGDGGEVHALLWDPATDAVTDIGFRVVCASAAFTRRVVLAYGDGGCDSLAVVNADGTVTPPTGRSVTVGYNPEFSADGTLVAFNEYLAEGDGSVTVLEFETGRQVFFTRIPDAFNVLWEDGDSVLVLAGTPADGYRILRCELAEGDCHVALSLKVDAPLGGGIWLVPFVGGEAIN